MAGAESTRMLPTLRLFKIGVQFDMEGKSGAERSEAAYSDTRRPAAGPDGLRPVDIAVIRELQEDLPLSAAALCAHGRAGRDSPRANCSRWPSHLKAQGYMRRMAAVLHHREAGFRANAMGVWVVPADRSDEVGRIMGSFKGVSHCYLRPTYPGLALQHLHHGARADAEDCQEVIDAIAHATGIGEYALLYSTKEYKKIRLRYFTPELETWEVAGPAVAGVGGGPLVTDGHEDAAERQEPGRASRPLTCRA